jgi:hypothetical protein
LILFTTAKPIRSDSRDEKASIYIPYAFRSFQGFDVLDIKGFRETKHMEIGFGTSGFTGLQPGPAKSSIAPSKVLNGKAMATKLWNTSP